MRILFAIVGVYALVACNSLPSAGPSQSEIVESAVENGGQLYMVPVNSQIANRARPSVNYGFPSAFFGGGAVNYETLQPGDTIAITVWENVDDGLFATLGQRVNTLDSIRIDASGNIFVPYVGQIRASGKSPEQLRQQIYAKLESQTPEPQVEVRVLESGLRGGVRIVSGSGASAVPFNEGNLSLANMLASAGVGAEIPEATTVTVRRGSQSGKILMSWIFENPKYDIALRDGDQIVVEADRRFYRMLGAGGAQAQVPFERARISLLDAVAANGGLNANVSDPSGIFVFRTLSAGEASRVLGGSYGGSVDVVFTFNLRDAQALFYAEDFLIQNRDTVYITEAPFVSWTRVIGQITGGISSVTTLSTTVSSL